MVKEIKFPRRGKLVVGIMSSNINLIEDTEQKLIKKFGKTDFESSLIPFNHTDYYTEEMGEGLQKKFVSFSELIAVEDLPYIKIFTNDLEKRTMKDGKRQVNIDPGYLTHSQLVLGTTKAYAHRVYLREGIYADLTYICKRKKLQPLDWTYPDFRDPNVILFFQKVRERYLKQIRISR
jgi:hypothetical protein